MTQCFITVVMRTETINRGYFDISIKLRSFPSFYLANQSVYSRSSYFAWDPPITPSPFIQSLPPFLMSLNVVHSTHTFVGEMFEVIYFVNLPLQTNGKKIQIYQLS